MFRFVVAFAFLIAAGSAQGQAPASHPAQKSKSTAPPAKSDSGIGSKRIVPLAERQQFESESSDRVAIVVAVGNYPEADGLPALRFPLADALELSGELKRQGYTVFELLNNEATADNVRGKIRSLSQTITKDKGTVIFFFTGHGFQSGEKNYLATYGTNINNLTALGLPLDDVKDLLAASGARRRIMLIDACRSDPGAKAAVSSFKTLAESEGLHAILSTRPGGFSYEDATLQHGIFTSFLLKGLRGAAVGPDGLITFDGIASYVTTSVYKYAADHSLTQKPFQLSDASGDFLIAAAGKATEAQIAETTPAMPPSSNALILANLDDHSRFFVDMSEDKLRLYKLPAKDPYAVLDRKPTKDESVLFFSGPASGQARLDAIVHKTGSQVTELKGRYGTHRNPADVSPPQWVPLLDEEKSTKKPTSAATQAVDIGSKVTKFWKRDAKSQQNADSAQKTAKVAEVATETPDQKEYNWREFHLATEYQGK